MGGVHKTRQVQIPVHKKYDDGLERMKKLDVNIFITGG
jgi:hypothetical protein